MKTITAMFKDYEDANRAFDQLLRAGFTEQDISVTANDTVVVDYRRSETAVDVTTDTASDSTDAGMAGGAVAGGLIGLLIGLSAITVPGVGPLLTWGALATAVGTTTIGAGVGAAAGGLLGALIGLGIPEKEAEGYVQGIREGNILITVQAMDQRAEEAESILRSVNATRVNQYQQAA